MRIGIIGAGISGLSAALALAKQGHEVAVFQREREVGGLIATFDFGGTRIEHFYHFLCGRDTGYFMLCRELDLARRVRFAKAPTGFYYEGRHYPFSSPLDLLRFTPIPLSQRIRFGLFALEARWRNEWAQLDELRAKPWLIDRIGRRAYDVIWDPLLSLKFGARYDQISAAWVWHRLWRVAQSAGRMGYLEGGTALLLDTLVARLRELGVQLHTEQPVDAIAVENGAAAGLRFANGDTFSCDRVVSTVPLSVLADLLPESESAYAASLRRIEYIGVVCLVFKLARPFSSCFWLNVNDHRVPFNGVIEYTNLNRRLDCGGHIVYVPYYVATDHPLYRMDEEALRSVSWEALKTVQPHLRDADLLDCHVARSAYAQAICTTGFLRLLPEPDAPVRGLHLLDSTFLYPEDRTQSGHILKAWACAERIGA
jgi:protoporphyrinogen oxidase